jgi:hypothetical protein
MLVDSARRTSVLWPADPYGRLLVFLFLVAAAFAAAVVAAEFLESFFHSWNDARLAPAAAWLQGYQLYYGFNEGPLLGLMYPPLAAFAYLPAVCCDTPERAVAAGDVLTSLYYFGPALGVMLIEARRRKAHWPAAGLCLAVFVLFSGAARALAGPAFWIHADAPALGLGALAVAMAYFRQSRLGAAADIAMAVPAMFSVLAKQTMLPLLVALPLVCLVYDGRRAASRCVLWLIVVAAAGVLLVAGLTDLSALVLNTVVLPGRHPWTGPALATLTAAGAELLVVALGPLALCVWCGLVGPSAEPEPAATYADWLRQRRWTMWIVVALTLLPTALLGRAKVGGDVNALAGPLYLLTIAASLTVLRAQPDVATAGANSGSRARLGPAIALPLAAVVLCAMTWPRLREIPRLLDAFPNNPERTGFAFARRHPGEVYFPSNPLITLYSERRAHHLSDGVSSRALARIEVGDSHIQAFLPRRMEWVAFVGPGDFSGVYLPQFNRRVQVDGLPAYWTVLARQASPPAE